ncbi:hypothetical protein GCM10023085_33590 [Actinomadura viridis]
MCRVDHERGEGALGYLGVILLIAVVAGVLVTGDIGTRVVAACESAVCAVMGKSCPARSAAGAASPTPVPSPVASPARPPIPKPACTPGDENKWVEGLHAHNDYENDRPLWGALDQGATSIEADIWVGDDGELHLQHQIDGGSRGTLRKTYVEPLIARAAANGGQIYQGREKPFVILLEVKKGDDTTYQKIIDQTRDLPPGVQLLMPGDTPGAVVGKQPPNVTFFLTPGQGCTLPPQVDPASPEYDRAYAQSVSMLNGSYRQCADRNGDRRVSDEEQRLLNEFVQKAHDAGLKVRFVEGPDGRKRDHKDPGGFKLCAWKPGRQGCERQLQEEWWEAQRIAGVDYLDTAHVKAGAQWMRKCGG